MNDRSGYPWSEGDALFAEELNAAIANAGFQANVANVLNFGAILDGTTDDTAAVQAALNSGYTHVVVPAGRTAYCPGGIIVPSGVTLDGTSLQMENGNHPGPGSTILVSAATPVAVTLGAGAPGSRACALKNIRVESVSTAPASTTIGVLVNQANPATLITDVMVFGFGIGIETLNGITIWLHNIFTGRISNAHYVNNGTPEIHVTKWRMGVNTGDAYPPVISTCYIRCTGGTGGAGAANTMKFAQCQFNDSNLTGHLMEFVNRGNTSSDASLYVFEGCFCQGVGQAYFYSDATWLDLRILQIVGCDFASGAGTPNPCPMFALDPTTAIHELYMSASTFFLSLNLAPVAPADLKNLHITGCCFSNGPVSFTAAGGGTMTFVGNMVLGGTLTLAGNWTDLAVIGNNFNGVSSLVNNATGNVKIIGTNPYAVWLAGISTPHRSLIGSALSLNNAPQQGEFEQMTLTGAALDAGYCAVRNVSAGSANGAVFVGQVSRGAYGTHGAVAAGDGVYTHTGYADDGTNWRTPSGNLIHAVDGPVSAGVVPGRFVFQTASAAGVVTEALRLDRNQQVRLAGLPATTTYANDAAAAAGGVAVGQLYRSGSAVMVRVT